FMQWGDSELIAFLNLVILDLSFLAQKHYEDNQVNEREMQKIQKDLDEAKHQVKQQSKEMKKKDNKIMDYIDEIDDLTIKNNILSNQKEEQKSTIEKLVEKNNIFKEKLREEQSNFDKLTNKYDEATKQQPKEVKLNF